MKAEMTSEVHLNQDIYQLMVISHQKFMVPVHSIVSVFALEDILQLPHTPDWLSGVAHIRNAIVPVVNLNELIGSAEPVIQSAYPLLVLLRHPRDSQRWLALCVTDLSSVLLKEDLHKMSSSSAVHPCLKAVLDNHSQKIHWLDISKLFEQLIKEQA